MLWAIFDPFSCEWNWLVWLILVKPNIQNRKRKRAIDHSLKIYDYCIETHKPVPLRILALFIIKLLTTTPIIRIAPLLQSTENSALNGSFGLLVRDLKYSYVTRGASTVPYRT